MSEWETITCEVARNVPEVSKLEGKVEEEDASPIEAGKLEQPLLLPQDKPQQQR